MTWALPFVLWLTASLMLWRRWRLRLDEAAMGGGLVAATEAVALMTALGLSGHLQEAPAASATLAFILVHLLLSYGLRHRAVHKAAKATAPALIWAALAAAAAVLAFRIYLASSLPLDSWDALSYHVPMLLRWIQQGNLDLSGSSGPSRYYPWNGELLSTWLSLLSGSSLDPVRTAQTYPLLWMACAGAVIGRRLGGRRWGGAVGAALLALPIAVLQAGMPYVDVFYGSFWVCAAAAALCWDRCGRAWCLVLWGAAFGLAMGSKATLYFQAPLVFQLALTLALRPRRLKGFVRALPGAAAAALLAGAYCYGRNWVQHGNPIYPYTLKIAGHALFSGIMAPQELLVTVERRFVDSTAGWLTYPFHETMKGVIVLDGSNGYGPLFAAGWLLCLFPFVRAFRRRDWGAIGFLALMPLSVLFFLKMQPTREPRYMVFLPAVPIAGLAYLLSGLRGVPRQLAFAGWAFGIGWGLLGALGGLAEDAGVLRGWQVLKTGASVDPHEYYRWQYGTLGEAWTALDRVLKKDDVVVVNYGELELPWAGLPPRGRIVEVEHSVSDFPQTLGSKTDEGWLALLDSARARYFVLWSPGWYPDVGTAERAAIAKFSDRFKNIGHWQGGGMGLIDLYEVIPAKR
jgi:hypothetical protein